MDAYTYVPQLPPYSHQAAFLAERAEEPAWGLLWEQGTGKTKALIDDGCLLYERNLIDAVVVLASNGVHRNWLTDELPTHLPERLREWVKAAAWHTGKAGTQRHAKEMDELLKWPHFPWFMISYDGIMTDAGIKMLKKFLAKHRCLIIGDETHNIKAPAAKRTVRAMAQAKYARYRRIATGTPISQGPFDIYSQIKFLDEHFWNRRGFPTFHVFKQHFGIWIKAEDVKEATGFDPGYDKLDGYRNLDELYGYLQEISQRVLKKDVLDLPEKLYTKRYYELTPEQRRLMAELKKQFVARVGGGTVTAELAITRLLRAQQITCGYVPLDSEDEHAPLHVLEGGNPRLKLFKEIAEGVAGQAIVWARFSKDVDLILEALEQMGMTAVRFDGRVSSDEAEKAKVAFQRGEVQWFVANPAKGKEGITLVGAKTVIYYNNTFRLLDRLQSEDRAHRIGQTENVTYIDMIAEDSPDEHVVRSLRNKMDIASQITGDELKEWL